MPLPGNGRDRPSAKDAIRKEGADVKTNVVGARLTIEAWTVARGLHRAKWVSITLYKAADSAENARAATAKVDPELRKHLCCDIRQRNRRLSRSHHIVDT